MLSKKPLSRVLITVVAVLLVLLNRYALPKDAQQSAQPVEAAQSGLYWGNPSTLQDHFDRHGADFGATDPEDYALAAHALYLARGDFQVKNDNGTLRVYDADTGAFGAYNRDGTTKTFFKPDDGQAYFDRQPGKLVK